MSKSNNPKKEIPETIDSYFAEKYHAVARRYNILGPKIDRRKGIRVNWSLQLKLMGIISLIILFTTTIIIGIATNLFKTENEVRIREENIKLVDLIGNNVQTALTSIILRTKQMAITIDTKYITDKKVFTDLFFEVNSDIVFLGVYDVEPDHLKLSSFAVDEKFILEHKLQDQFFQELILGSQKSLDAALRNEVFLFNINRENQTIPFLGIAVPYMKDSLGTKVILSVVRLDNILTSFEKKGIFQTFMVDLNGNILAHPEKEKILFVSNMRYSLIVQELLKAPLSNGQKKYIEDGKSFLGSYKKLDSINAGIISIVLEDKVFEEVYNIRRRNIYISAIALFVSLLIVFLFSKTITQPIIDLLNATIKISRGDFNLDIRSKTKDEVGLLTDHFIQMSKGLQEREKVKDALGRFVNPSVVTMVLNNELKLGGENKMVAVLFSDIRGFTAISEQLSPEEVVEFLNQYLTLMVSCVELTFGVVDKFIGDALVATWGAVNTLGNPVENAINSALMMRDQIIRFNETRGGDRKPIIKIGCGLNYGPVIVGQIGSPNRVEYTVIGDTVNLASRIETLNKPFGTDILITEQMYEEVKDIYIVEKMKEILVKGKKEPQTIYAVIGRKDDTDPDVPKTLKDLQKALDIPFNESKFELVIEAEEVKYAILDK